jgi:hypothetical protein
VGLLVDEAQRLRPAGLSVRQLVGDALEQLAGALAKRAQPRVVGRLGAGHADREDRRMPRERVRTPRAGIGEIEQYERGAQRPGVCRIPRVARLAGARTLPIDGGRDSVAEAGEPPSPAASTRRRLAMSA